ncbi:MAG: nuclear transport factor 2 family protein, partial [Gammaproteobacteria bacterium]
MHPSRVLSALLITLFATAGASASGASVAPDQAWFQKNTQALFDALTSGDASVWDKAMTDDCIITSEDGDVETKAQLLKETRPLPPGFSGDIKVKDLKVQDLGGAAVVHYLIDEYERVFGQQLHTKYVT